MTSSKNGWKAFIIALSIIGVLVMAIGGVLWSETRGNAEEIGKLKDFHGVDYRDAEGQLAAIRADLATLARERQIQDSLINEKLDELLGD